jgi:zinc/manganese transport system substrate-binding protein
MIMTTRGHDQVGPSPLGASDAGSAGDVPENHAQTCLRFWGTCGLSLPCGRRAGATAVSRTALTAAALAAAALATASLATVVSGATCGIAGAAGAPVRVVAAENFWGNIASQVGGRDVRVTSLITDPSADPHLFETNAQNAATLAEAQVVIENGAGYDTWMGSLLGADGGRPRIVNAASVLHVGGSDPNPHLWYDIPRVPAVAAAIASALAKAAPQDASTFAKNLSAFDASLAPLKQTIATIKQHFHNVPVAYTERVPGYLLADANLDVKTPPGFARAIEDGVDPGAADTVAMRQLVTKHDINVLLYNVQTVTPVTTQMRSLAKQHAIPVVGVSETMPSRATTYQQWQQSQLDSLLRALQQSRNP